MGMRRTPLTVLFYTALIVLVTAMVLRLLPLVLPDLIAGRISRNSEGIVLLLILAVWIQFVRPRLAHSARRWPITAAAAGASLLVGGVLFLTDPVNEIKTLNETFLAAAVLIPYLELPRPLPRWVPVVLTFGLLVVVVAGHSNEFIVLMAEALGALILVPVGLDLIDRGILDPTARTVGWQRAAWYAFLLAGPIVFWVTDNGATVNGTAGVVLGYAGRTTEAFLCLLALELYFAVGLGRTRPPRTSHSPARAVAR